MNFVVMEKIAGLVKAITELSKVAAEATDSEKYANSIEKLNQGVSDSYEQMRMVVMNSNDFTEEQKLEKLKEIADQEFEVKMKCSEALNGRRESIANIAMEIIKGFLTCGISFAPEIANRLKLTAANEGRWLKK